MNFWIRNQIELFLVSLFFYEFAKNFANGYSGFAATRPVILTPYMIDRLENSNDWQLYPFLLTFTF